LRKVSGTHRYHVTKGGRQLLTASRTPVRQLTQAA
jgi:hypothetical protein